MTGEPWDVLEGEPDPDPFDLSSIDRFLDEQRILLQWPEDWSDDVDPPEPASPPDDDWAW